MPGLAGLLCRTLRVAKPDRRKELANMPGEMGKVQLLWSCIADHPFNTFSVGTVFKKQNAAIVTACLDGVVRIYDVPTSCKSSGQKIKAEKCLETKGGPIQALALHDVTRFYSNDVVVADSRGVITIFCNEQILTRKVVTETCVHYLQIQQDLLGNIAIVTSDSNGRISALSPYNNLWSLRLTDIRRLRGLGMTPSVQSMLACRLADQEGLLHDYVLAADNCQHLYVIHQGSVVSVINTPAPISAMCVGNFLDSASLDTSLNACGSTSAAAHQVALGSETGSVYIMENLEIFEEFANIQSPVTILTTLPNTEPNGKDAILCAGNFTALCVLSSGKDVARYETPGWINSVVTADVDDDGQLEVVVGCHDNSIHALKVNLT